MIDYDTHNPIKLPYAWIKVGDAARNTIEGLADLADDIRARGLQHPIVVDANHNLIAGWRRYMAWSAARPEQAIPTYVADDLTVLDYVRAELDDQTCRLPMVASELFRFAERVIPLAHIPDGLDRGRHGFKLLISNALGTTTNHLAGVRYLGAAAQKNNGAVEDLVLVDAGQMTMNYAAHRERARRQGKPIPTSRRTFSDGTRIPNPRERVALIVDYAARGYTSRQIGELLGIDDDRVRREAKNNQIEILADIPMLRTHRLDHDRIVRNVVDTADAAVMSAGLVNIRRLDPEQLDDWITALSHSIDSLQTFVTNMKEHNAD